MRNRVLWSFAIAISAVVGACSNEEPERSSPTEPRPAPAISAQVAAATAPTTSSSSICIAFTKLRSDTQVQLAADSTNADLQAQLVEVKALVDDVCN